MAPNTSNTNKKGSAHMSSYWHHHDDGRHRAADGAPTWVHVRAAMINAFPTYYEEDRDTFSQDVQFAIQRLNKLKRTPDGPAFLGDGPEEADYSHVTDATLDDDFGDLDGVIDAAVGLFRGMPNWAHPQTLCNVSSTGNKAGIIGAMLANVFTPNILEGEYSWNVVKAEMESAAIIARLVGWDVTVAGGIYTYGGSGCYLYGLKYALASVFGRDSRCTGIRKEGKILVSQQGHYCMMNASDWLGLGMNNIITIETNHETNAMDTRVLRDTMRACQGRGIPIVAVVCTMGTTDAFAIDPVDEVRKIIDDNPNPDGFGKPFLYCDAVIGWSWLMFQGYDYDDNPLGFSESVLPIIRGNYEKISNVVHADAFGLDFHKTGWAPYNCSMFAIKDLNRFRGLMTRPGSAYLQARTDYNPGLYTLEVSRSGSYAMAGWATLKFLGRQGFQAVLGGILHVEKYLRDLIAQQKDMVCVNADDHGFVTLLRVYPEGVDARAQYAKEVSDAGEKESLDKHNQLQADMADVLWSWFRSAEKVDGMLGPYTSYTSGFRPTDYNDAFDPAGGIVYALKAFPMSVNVTPRTMDDLIEQFRIARRLVAEGGAARFEKRGQQKSSCPPPYAMETPAVECKHAGDDSKASSKTPHTSKVTTLLSGVGPKVGTTKPRNDDNDVDAEVRANSGMH